MAFGGRSKGTTAADPNGQHSELEAGEGFEMGERRDAGRDGAGTYEMVGMPSKKPEG